MLSILQDQLEKKNISYTKLTGATKKREEVIEKFTSGQADVFLFNSFSNSLPEIFSVVPPL
jgi:SNF2 family DNA or RNA helicase